MACCGGENSDDNGMSSSQQELDSLQNFELSSGFVLNTEVAKKKREIELRLLSLFPYIEARRFRRSSSIPLINGFGDNSQGCQVDTLGMRRNSSPFVNHRALCLKKAKLAMVLDVVMYPEIAALRSGGAQLYKELEANLDYKRLCLKNRLTSKLLPPHTRTSANRIFQIKQEEKMDIVSREAMHERKVHTVMQLSQIWEETLNLDDNIVKPLTIRNMKLIPVFPVPSLTKKPGKDHQDF